MLIGQLLAEQCSLYERKHHQLDTLSLALKHEFVSLIERDRAFISPSGDRIGKRALSSYLSSAGVAILHVYGEPADGLDVAIPFVAPSSRPGERRWFRRAPASPAALTSPFGSRGLPEAVDPSLFQRVALDRSEKRTIGSLQRASTSSLIQLTMLRIARVRGDVEWREFAAPPSAIDLQEIALWVDPAVDEADFDGFTAEALVAGLPVIASQTAINEQRLDRGAAGILVKRNDPNELSHAILKAMFKPETIEPRIFAARQIAERFRVERRRDTLDRMYREIAR